MFINTVVFVTACGDGFVGGFNRSSKGHTHGAISSIGKVNKTQCLALCIAKDACRGVDYEIAARSCYFHTAATLRANPLRPNPDVDQYRIYCTSGMYS